MWLPLLPLGIPWHPKQRLYLYASHGLVWLSDAKGCVLLNQESGLVKGQLKYPHYQRILPELDSLSEDTSPYAQTGYSIWSIRMYNFRSLTVVHDIERCSPIIVILKFWNVKSDVKKIWLSLPELDSLSEYWRYQPLCTNWLQHLEHRTVQFSIFDCGTAGYREM